MTEHAEVWKPVVGWEGCYSVSDLGRVRSEHREVVGRDGKRRTVKERIMRPMLDLRGYERVYLRTPIRSKNASVHRLVAEAFIGPLPPGMETRHGPGGKRDNRLVNLCYGTPAENAADRERDGTNRKGPSHHNTKLTDQDIREIRNAKGKVSTRELALMYGINKANVSRIQRRERWTHVPDDRREDNANGCQPVEYITKCLGCGRFLPMRRWAIRENPTTAEPLCTRCEEESHPAIQSLCCEASL